MISKFLLAATLLFAVESLAPAQENRTESAPVILDQSVHFITADGSNVVIEPGQYEVEAAEEWLRVIPGERRDALLLKASSTMHKEFVSEPLARLIAGGDDQISLALLLPNGSAMEAVGSTDGVRSRGITRGRVARASVPQKKITRRPTPSTRRTPTKKASPKPPSLTQQIQTLSQQIQGLQATINSQQQTINSLNSRLAHMEGGIQIANNGTITIGQSGKVIVQGSEMEVNTSLVDVNAGVSEFSGAISTSHITTDSIASKTYTPGAGNIW